MSFLDKLLGGNTLYYPGCLTKFVSKNIQENYEKLLNKMGVDYIKLSDKEFCCGSPVFNAGYYKDFDDLIKKNHKVFLDHGVKKIITNCPACYKIFSKVYPERFPEWGFEVEHFTITVLNYLRKKKIQKKVTKQIVYHDPCHLGRQSRIIDEPRRVLELLGYEVIELKDNREKSLCCGAGGGLRTNKPLLANKIALIRLKQLLSTGCNVLVTPCTLCFKHLEDNAKRLSHDIVIKEFSEVLVDELC